MAENNSDTTRPPMPDVVVMQALYGRLREHTDTMALCQTLATQKLRIDAALAVTESLRSRLKQAEDALLSIRHEHKTTRLPGD